MKVRLNTKQQKVSIEDIKLPSSQEKKKDVISTLESLAKSSKVIYQTKSHYFKQPIQAINLSQISEVDLTITEKGLKPYWKNCSKEISEKLWLPIEIGGADSATTYLNGFSHIGRPNSFQSVMKRMKTKTLKKNCQKTLCLSWDFSTPNITDKEEIHYTRKIKIDLTERQKKVFKTCLEGSNYYYNLTVDYLNSLKEDILTELRKLVEKKSNNYFNYSYAAKFVNKTKLIPTFITVRNKLIKRRIADDDPDNWLKDIPDCTKNTAIEDVWIAFDVNVKKYIEKFNNEKIKSSRQEREERKITVFELQNKDVQSFGIVSRSIDIKERIIFPRRTNHDQFGLSDKDYNKVKNEIVGDSRIVCRPHNKWYLCLSLKRKPELSNKPYNVVALDPGIRTFQTFYSSDGLVGKLGEDVHKKLFSIGKKMDKIISKRDKLKHKTKQEKFKNKRTKHRMNKRLEKLRTKLKNLADDLHHKTANYLTTNFKNIIIPNTNVTNMIKKDKRNIGKQTVRSQLMLAHYKFREYLKWLAKSRGNQVIEVSEAYTSKTCGKCGHVNSELYGNKIYKCPNKNCDYILDRDIHGARNVLLRMLTTSGWMKPLS